jgi:S1-C subfamily serine protease
VSSLALRRWLTLSLLTVWTACASRDPGPGAAWPDDPQGPGESALPLPVDPASAGPGAAAAPSCPALAGERRLHRSALVRTVDQGLGRWLAGVGVTAVRDQGRFQGWRVERLHPGDPCFGDVDLRPGDIVTRVNGSNLERPEQANQIFQGLRTAPRLQIERLRDGSTRTLTYEIVD